MWNEIVKLFMTNPEAQAAVIGLLVSGAVALYRRWRNNETEDDVAKAARFTQAVVAAAIGIAATLYATGQLNWANWLPAWLLAVLTSQAAYGMYKGLAYTGGTVVRVFAPEEVK